MHTPHQPPHAWGDLLDHLADYLRLQRESGIETIAVTTGQPTLLPTPAPQPPPAPARPATPAPGSAAPAGAEAGLTAVARDVASCQRCPLCRSRNRTVPGQGSPTAKLLFVGEGPGADEDRQGVAFVGAAGKLLTRMIEAMGYTRDEVFIANVVKCRPPQNRTPLPEESEACLPYLHRQIELLQPTVIVTLGATPLKALLDNPRASVTRLRGTWHTYQNIALMPTFHPAYLLRKPEAKRDAWNDLQQVMARLREAESSVNSDQ